MSYLAVLNRHARSFRWGGFFLTPMQLKRAATVYAFCRTIDDIADESLSDSKLSAQLRLKSLYDQLMQSDPEPLVRDFLNAVNSSQRSRIAAQQLILGALSDTRFSRNTSVESVKDLLTYCYRVAGVVGIMMCDVLEVKSEQAVYHAIDMGIAMQLTNILRDIKQDLSELDRVYLPHSLVDQRSLQIDFLKSHFESKRLNVCAQLETHVRSLYGLSESFYTSGFAGLRSIPWQSRFAIFVAATLYRQIGREVVKGLPASIDRRVYLGTMKKIFYTGVAFVHFIGHSVWLTLSRQSEPKHDKALHRTLRDMPLTSQFTPQILTSDSSTVPYVHEVPL